MDKKKVFAISCLILVCTFFLGLAYYLEISSDVEMKSEPEETAIEVKPPVWRIVGSGESVPDPGSGDNTGICGFWVFETGSTYTAELNTSDTGYIDGGYGVNATDLENIPHTDEPNSDLALIVWARFNTSDASGDVNNTKCNMTWTGNITGTTAPDHIYHWTNGSFLHVNFVWDNANSGFTLQRSEQIEIQNIIIKSLS